MWLALAAMTLAAAVILLISGLHRIALIDRG